MRNNYKVSELRNKYKSELILIIKDMQLEHKAMTKELLRTPSEHRTRIPSRERGFELKVCFRGH